MSTTQYDSDWDYKVTVDIVSDSGNLKVTKIETKRKTKPNWFTVTKQDQKNAIKLKVFGIKG
jgi:ribosomal protein L28